MPQNDSDPPVNRSIPEAGVIPVISYPDGERHYSGKIRGAIVGNSHRQLRTLIQLPGAVR